MAKHTFKAGSYTIVPRKCTITHTKRGTILTLQVEILNAPPRPPSHAKRPVQNKSNRNRGDVDLIANFGDED